jgi:hypothetical protein
MAMSINGEAEERNSGRPLSPPRAGRGVFRSVYSGGSSGNSTTFFARTSARYFAAITGSTCYTGGCSLPFHENACGGISESDLVL